MDLARIVKYIKIPRLLLDRTCVLFADKFANDERLIRARWFFCMDYKLNLTTPRSFNEKLQWLKLYYRNPIYTAMVDKIAVKDYVAGIIGEEHIIPTIAIYDSVDQIDWKTLPSQFVIKCTHDSGGSVICSDKSVFDIRKAKDKLCKAFKGSNYIKTREWPYQNVTKRLICEKYMVDGSGFELKDYKFFCFDGVPRLMYVVSGRHTNDIRFNYYDMESNLLDIRQFGHHADKSFVLPECFGEMKQIATALSKGIPHVRVDLYEVNGFVYFGEMTFFHFSGFSQFYPEKWDWILGDMLSLPTMNHKKCNVD